MSLFPPHSTDTAPDASKPLLQEAQQKFGFIPNLISVMSTSPALTEAYIRIDDLFEQSGLNAAQQQTVLLTVSRYHECCYCVSAHSTIASMNKVPQAVIQAIREDRPIEDNKLQALREFTLLLLENRGWASEAEQKAFLDAGYEPSHILDVVVGIAQKTMSNFTNHMAQTPLDKAFSQDAWEPSSSGAAKSK